MKVFKPGYYDAFRCIAGKCKHSCCIGWEIDVDRDKVIEYKNAKGSFGEKLRENIAFDAEEPHFILKDDDRCPFLNCDNLCDIIINMKEESLCQICRDHPRFRNFFANREEVGIGMCCEEAARLVITYKEKVKIPIDACDDEEEVFFNMREQVFSILQDRDWTMAERLENLMLFYDLAIPDKDWVKVFQNLERLDEGWSEKIQLLNKKEQSLTGGWDSAFEQIMVYFVYRHLPEGIYDGRIKERLLFATLSTNIIRKLFSMGEQTEENLVEICRMYSSEIEYSEENIEKLLDELEE